MGNFVSYDTDKRSTDFMANQKISYRDAFEIVMEDSHLEPIKQLSPVIGFHFFSLIDLSLIFLCFIILNSIFLIFLLTC